VQRSKPPPLKPVSRNHIRDLHTPILRGDKRNLLCAAVSKNAKRAKPVQPQKKPLSIEELHRQMMARGLITRLPDPALDIDDDDPDDQPVLIEGEPLSETIIRERR
jgi:hypothetical protein